MNDAPLASRLLGKKIGRWQVIEKRQRTEGDCSGFYSTCYTVKDNEGNLAFLKAYNYVYAFGSNAGSADTLKLMVENFTYERDLLSALRVVEWVHLYLLEHTRKDFEPEIVLVTKTVGPSLDDPYFVIQTLHKT